MIIDFHTHTFPDQIAASAVARLSDRANIPAYSSGTAGGLLLAERAAGVDRSIILPVATKPEQVHHINDAAATHNEHAFVTNMFSFACIHPDYADWKQELDRIAARNMRGIKLHPAYQQTDLDDPKYLRCASTLKHFYGNNTEVGRGWKNSSIDPRNKYELYLEPFRRCIEESGAEGIITAYNRINGTVGPPEHGHERNHHRRRRNGPGKHGNLGIRHHETGGPEDV